ncbi:MAG: MATE family efflux transporter [Calditrichaeota bacterium]|nr:MAG: MATE family efflux transporter [Calditrichota bacterium]MBL1204295.1 MATE family efflux transporter [Calditrichota bacterium]NOG44125.1 MATE family efflux transporter [Calditrichota bacterium]
MSLKEHFRKTIQLAIPLVIGQLGHMALGVVDNLMIGQLGPVFLAAASLANAIFVQFMILGLGLTFALSALVAAANRPGNEEECSSLLHHSFAINMVASVLLLVVMEAAIGLLPYLGQEERIINLTAPYLRIIAISIIPMLFFQTYRQFSDGLTFVKPAMYIMLLANVVNVFLNWALIFGNLGFPRLELNGAGISTLGNRIFAGVAMFLYVIFNSKFKKFNPRYFRFKYHKELILKILRIGIPSSLQAFLEVFAFTGVAFIIGWIGAYELAAHQIALTLAAVTFMFALGISQASAIRVGIEFGKDQKRETLKAGFSAILLAILVMGVNGLIFVVFRHELVGFFVDDFSVREIAARLLIIAAIFQIFDGIQAVGVGVLRGIQDVKIPTFIVFIAYWILSIPIGYFLGITWDYSVDGVWAGFVSGLASAAVMLSWRFWKKTRE